MRGAGRLREHIEVVRKITVVQADGSESVAWDSILTTHASVKMNSGGIDTIASQESITQVFRFVIRYRPDNPIEIDDRLIWRDRNFKISKLDFDIMRTFIVITSRTDNESTSPGIDSGS